MAMDVARSGSARIAGKVAKTATRIPLAALAVFHAQNGALARAFGVSGIELCAPSTSPMRHAKDSIPTP